MTILPVLVVALSLSVTVSVDPHVENREVSVILIPVDRVHADYWKTQSLDDEGGTFTAKWADLPKGTYDVLALLQRYAMDGSEGCSAESTGFYLSGGRVTVGVSSSGMDASADSVDKAGP